MKKLLSVLLATMMLLSSVVFAEEDASKYAEDVEILKSFNIISYFSGATDVNAAVTRGQFVQAVMELAYEAIPDCKGNTGFVDVEPDSEYADAIAYAKLAGVVDGVSENEFYPDTVITGIQASKILLTAMGYKDLADFQGGYMTGYYAVANRVKLLDGVTAGESETITAGAMARLILNAGFSQPLDVQQNVGGVVFNVAGEDTIFWRIHSISKGKGVLTSNEYTAIDTSADMGGGRITIGDFRGYAYNNINSEKYIGYYVNFYYKVAESGNMVLYITPDKKNDVITINGANVKSFVGTELSYYKNDDKTASKTKTIPLSAAVIYNGRLITTYTSTDFVGITGEIVLVDNNSDNVIDVVNIVSYENYVINSIDRKSKIIYDLLDGRHQLNYSNEYNVNAFIIWDANGQRIAVDDLKTNDVLTVAKSKDSKYIRALLCNEQISGTVTGRTSDENGAFVSIDGVSYEIEERCNTIQGAKMVSNESITVYLDVLGRVAYAIPKTSKEGFAAVVRCIDGTVNSETGRAALRIITSTGISEMYEFAERIVIDGYGYTNLAYVPSDVENSRIIRYKINDKNQIKWIDTPRKTTEAGGSIHSIATLSNAKYIGNSKSFAGSLQMNNSMLVFTGPEVKTNATAEDYGVKSTADIVDQGRYTGEAYAVADDAVVADVVLLYEAGTDNLKHTSPTAVIAKMVHTINSDNEEVYDLTLISRDSNGFNLQVPVADYYAGATVGDVIKYEKDSTGAIKQMEVIFDSETTDLNHNPSASRGTPLTGLGTSYDSESLSYWGTITNRNGSIFQFELAPTLLANTSNKTRQFTYHDLSIIPAKILVVNTQETSSKERVRTGTIDDIKDTFHFGTGSRAYFYTGYGRVSMLVVYK